MPRIRWTPTAFSDLRAIVEYIAADNAAAAGAMARRIRDAINRLARFPGLGREGRVAGTRELVLAGTPYIIAYRVNGSPVEILAVLHGARRWPNR